MQAAIQKFQIISVVLWFYWCSRSCRFLSYIFFVWVPYSSPTCFALVNSKEWKKIPKCCKVLFSQRHYYIVITNICITSPGRWENYDFFLNCNYRFLATGESYRSLSLPVWNPPQLDISVLFDRL